MNKQALNARTLGGHVYSELVKDHALYPRNREIMANPDLSGEGRFSRCGDKVKLFIRLDSGRIARASFQASACGPAIAAVSLATTLITDLSLEQARQVLITDLVRTLSDLPPSKRHAILLVLECLAQIIEQSSMPAK